VPGLLEHEDVLLFFLVVIVVVIVVVIFCASPCFGHGNGYFLRCS
jgi:hypothetical protein